MQTDIYWRFVCVVNSIAACFLYYLNMTMKAVRTVEISVTVHPITQHHIPGDLNIYLYRCENLRSCKIPLFEFLAVVLVAFQVFWDVAVLSLTFLLHCLTIEEECTTMFRNVGKHSCNSTVSHFRKPWHITNHISHITDVMLRLQRAGLTTVDTKIR